MRTLRARFVVSHILPVLILIPLAAIALIYLLETQVLLDDLSNQLSQQADLIANVAEIQDGVWQDAEQANAFVTNINRGLSRQIILYKSNGDVLATSNVPSVRHEEMVEALERSEVAKNNQQVVVYYSLARQLVIVTVPAINLENEMVGMVQVSQGLEGVANRYGRLHWYILGVLGITLIASVIAGLFLALRLERPIKATTDAVYDIASGRRFEPIPEQGPEEIRLLTRSVNTLHERLTLLEDTRRRLLANLVHEIGRPLGALRAAIHTLLMGADDDPAIRHELLSGVETEIKRMQPLLDDLAQLHGQILGTMDLDRRPVEISEWLPALLLPWRAAAQVKGLRWQMDIPANLPLIAIDADRLAQAVGNLVSNAIKYTPAGQEVAVSAGADRDRLWLRVSDTGPGIVPEEQEQIFQPFYRGTQQTRFPKGLGLGLTIARDLVVAHGGHLEIEPNTKSENRTGAIFTIFLPYRDDGGKASSK